MNNIGKELMLGLYIHLPIAIRIPLLKIFRFFRRQVRCVYNKEERRKYKLNIKWRKRKICLGSENPTKQFYIARRISEAEGHYSMFNTFLGHCLFAKQHSYIPVIDMQNYFSPIWQSKERQGKDNAWEYYYEQPGGYSLVDITKSKHLLLSNGINAPKLPNLGLIYYNEEEIEKWHSIYCEYIHLLPEIRKFIEDKIIEFDLQKRNVLAVSLRRGIEWGHATNDKAYSSYQEHPSLKDTISKTKELMAHWECDFVFLVIDDQEGLEIYKKEFGNKLLYIERVRPAYFRNSLPLTLEVIRLFQTEFPVNTQEEIFSRELKFVTEINIMAKCQCIICARTSANTSAFIINGGKFKHTYVFGIDNTIEDYFAMNERSSI